MNNILSRGLPLGAALALLGGCATPVAEQLSCSPPVALVETEPDRHYAPFPPRYYGVDMPRQFLRGGTGSTPLRYNLRVAGPSAVGERLSDHPAALSGGQERLVATETYGHWQ